MDRSSGLLMEDITFIRHERTSERVMVAVFWDPIWKKEIIMTKDALERRRKVLLDSFKMPESQKALDTWPEVG